MIGKVEVGKSFKGCLQYCLNDKQELVEGQEQLMKDRAEILLFNQCYGNEEELIQQFKEVRDLNPKLGKPVMHVTLNFPPEDQLSKYQLAEIAEACAKEIGFDKNQYVVIYHKDTKHQHVHIVINRVGYDGKTVSDSNSYKRIAEFCRRIERELKLKQVLSPQKFLPKTMRQELRVDQRKDQLKEAIRQSLSTSSNYAEFEQKMKQLKYTVIKSRGVAFEDAQKVYTKGSEVGFSWSKIEQLLSLPLKVKMEELQKMQTLKPRHTVRMPTDPAPKTSRLPETSIELPGTISPHVGKELENLLQPESSGGGINPALSEEENRRRKRKRQKLS